MPTDLQTYYNFAIQTAHLAGRLTLGHFQTSIRPDYKSYQTPVTIADRQAEELIRARIEQHYPSHAIIGEELEDKDTQGTSHRWFIDPIDGTKAFTRGIPLYAVLLGLEIEGKVEVGVAYFPALNQIVTAATGLGCWWNGRPARVSQVDNLKSAYLIHSDAHNFAAFNRSKAWERLKKATYHRAGLGDAYGYLLVATGRAEIMLDPIMNVWDCGPFPPILSEAGGYFGDWSGNPTIHANEALATTHSLLPSILELVESPD